MDRWLIRTVMAFYTEAYTVVKTDAGLSESWFTSRISTESTAVCMYVVSREARSGLSSELLYVEDLSHQQWRSLVDVWLNGELYFLTKD